MTNICHKIDSYWQKKDQYTINNSLIYLSVKNKYYLINNYKWKLYWYCKYVWHNSFWGLAVN